MTLGCKMYDAIDLLVLHKLIECVEVADIHLNKLIVWLILNVLEIRQVTCVGQLVEIDNVVLGILIHERRTTWLR